MVTPQLTQSLASRRGKDLLVPRGASFPASCIKCGTSATTPWRKKFYWHTPLLYLMIIFPGLLIYFIVALIVRKQMELNLPVCEQHHSDRKRYKLLAILMAIGFIPAGIALGTMGPEMLGWTTGILMFIAAVVFSQLSLLGLRATKIDENGGMFRGACDTFLNTLPDQQ